VDARTTSGSIVVQRCLGVCRVSTMSGTVQIAGAGEAEVRVDSGTAKVTAQVVRVRAVSGKVQITSGGDASAETVSGSIVVSPPSGTRARVEAAGRKRAKIDVPEGDDCRVRLRSVSGSMSVRAR